MEGILGHDGGSDETTVFCAACGTLHEDATALVRSLQVDIQNAERELRAKRNQITKLRQESNDALEQSPYYPAARELMVQWQSLCAPSARELGGDRLRPVIARLKGGFSKDQLSLAILGYSKFPFVVDGKRVVKGPPKAWFADAELIFRNPKNVEQGIRLASVAKPDDAPVALDRLDWQQVKRANRRLILERLQRRWGSSIDDTAGRILYPCPICDNDPITSLTIYPSDQTRIAYCYSCGADERALIKLIEDNS